MLNVSTSATTTTGAAANNMELEEEEEATTDNIIGRNDALLPARPAVAVSRAVQQLLERHGLAGVGRSNGNVTVGAFVQVNNNCLSGNAVGAGESESDLDSDFEPRIRPDPIGSTDQLCRHPAEDVDLNGNNNSTAGGDAEAEELSKLRCQSVRTEVLAEKFRRKNRCADYPGFAFASSVFSSDTMMKFNIIKNELHNIMNNQLKRVSFTIAHRALIHRQLVCALCVL